MDVIVTGSGGSWLGDNSAELIAEALSSKTVPIEQRRGQRTKMTNNIKVVGFLMLRAQPLHNEHLHIIQRMIEECDEVKLLIGSTNTARTRRNPFTFNERVQMISESIKGFQENEKVKFCRVPDTITDETWLQVVSAYVEHHEVMNKLYGCSKDKSTDYYLQALKEHFWFFDERTDKPRVELDATFVRDSWFSPNDNRYDEIKHLVPDAVLQFLMTHESIADEILTDQLNAEQKKKVWEVAPYPVTFTCADALVIATLPDDSNHVLLIKRAGRPQLGLWALPGGHLDQNETLLNCALRELKEETGLELKDGDEVPMVDPIVSDNPNRSIRGRYVTHMFEFALFPETLPEIKAADDAVEAVWVPLEQALLLDYFEDHGLLLVEAVMKSIIHQEFTE